MNILKAWTKSTDKIAVVTAIVIGVGTILVTVYTPEIRCRFASDQCSNIAKQPPKPNTKTKKQPSPKTVAPSAPKQSQKQSMGDDNICSFQSSSGNNITVNCSVRNSN